MQQLLADTNGWVRPQQVEAHVIRHLRFVAHRDVRDTVARKGGTCRVAGALVHVDGPNRGARTRERKERRDGAASATEVAKDTRFRCQRCIFEQYARTPVEVAPVEHPSIERQFPRDACNPYGTEACLRMAR